MRVEYSPQNTVNSPLNWSCIVCSVLLVEHCLVLILSSVMDYHYQGDTKALTDSSLLFPIFSFKHFNQYLPRQLKCSKSFPEDFSFEVNGLGGFFVFILLFIFNKRKKLTQFPQIPTLVWFLFYKGNEICQAAIHHLHCSTMSHLCVKYKTKAFCEKLLK